MITMPRISIQQQYAKLGYNSDPVGEQSIRQPRATFELNTSKPKLDIRSPRGELDIDQSKAWAALGVGSNLETMNHIYAKARNVTLQGIGRIVDKGNRLAAIHENTNAIADIATQGAIEFFEYDYYVDASYDNVDLHYTANKSSINAERGTVNLHAQMNPAELDYTRGKMEFYMLQHASVKIIPPQIDLKV
jgi:hypothetical protein